MMSNIQTNQASLFQRWQSLRVYNIGIHIAFLCFYIVGTAQSYSFFSSPPVFYAPLSVLLAAVFLSAYLIHCLINKKDQLCIFLTPILTLFTTLFMAMNSQFEHTASSNSFLYLILLLPFFYGYILSYDARLLIANNLIVMISYTFVAVVGEANILVFMFNLIFLLTLSFLTTYSNLRNTSNRIQQQQREKILERQHPIYLKSIIHDIRQPLSSLSLYSHLLQDTAKDPQQKIIIENLLRSSTQLDRWLSSLLELATLDAKKLQANIKNVPIESCLSTVVKKHKAKANSQGILLKTRFKNIVLYTDSKLLSEIIDNLLSNALLHGSQEKGDIILLTARQQMGSINIQVWNKGNKIANEQFNSLFDEQYYANNSHHDKAKGIGLGLAISQRKALLLNTKIKATTFDNGNCFSISVAKGIEIKSNDALINLRKENSERILLVDDDPSILIALSMLLKSWGYHVDCAGSSEQAIHLLTNASFFLIISDYRLPGNKTGIDLIQLAQQKNNIPAVLLTGDIEPEQLKGGERNYKMLHKPVKPAALRLLLRQLITN